MNDDSTALLCITASSYLSGMARRTYKVRIAGSNPNLDWQKIWRTEGTRAPRSKFLIGIAATEPSLTRGSEFSGEVL
jgi:hypothetical protein